MKKTNSLLAAICFVLVILVAGCASSLNPKPSNEGDAKSYYTMEDFESIIVGESTYADVYEIAPVDVMQVTSYGGFCEFPMQDKGYILIKFHGKELIVNSIEIHKAGDEYLYDILTPKDILGRGAQLYPIDAAYITALQSGQDAAQALATYTEQWQQQVQLYEQQLKTALKQTAELLDSLNVTPQQTEQWMQDAHGAYQASLTAARAVQQSLQKQVWELSDYMMARSRAITLHLWADQIVAEITPLTPVSVEDLPQGSEQLVAQVLGVTAQMHPIDTDKMNTLNGMRDVTTVERGNASHTFDVQWQQKTEQFLSGVSDAQAKHVLQQWLAQQEILLQKNDDMMQNIASLQMISYINEVFEDPYYHHHRTTALVLQQLI